MERETTEIFLGCGIFFVISQVPSYYYGQSLRDPLISDTSITSKALTGTISRDYLLLAGYSLPFFLTDMTVFGAAAYQATKDKPPCCHCIWEQTCDTVMETLCKLWHTTVFTYMLKHTPKAKQEKFALKYQQVGRGQQRLLWVSVHFAAMYHFLLVDPSMLGTLFSEAAPPVSDHSPDCFLQPGCLPPASRVSAVLHYQSNPAGLEGPSPTTMQWDYGTLLCFIPTQEGARDDNKPWFETFHFLKEKQMFLDTQGSWVIKAWLELAVLKKTRSLFSVQENTSTD